MFKKANSNRYLFLLFVTIALTLAVVTGVATGKSVTYHGNSDSYKFHAPYCRYYSCKKCTVEFKTREAAINAGYRPCKVCKP